MRDAGVGRVLVASLHQGISEVLPTRLGFYEEWLNAKGLRDGTIGLAPLYAVLSFLRQEEHRAYDVITTRAGEYAADWAVESMSPGRRAIIKAAPEWLRGRLTVGLAKRLVRSSYRGSRATSRMRRGTASINVRPSIFCNVREPAPKPLCGFYAAAFARLLVLFDLSGRVEVVGCRGAGGTGCIVQVALTRGEPVESDARPPEVA